MGPRLDAAIKASGKSRQEVADEAGTTIEQISRLTTGKQDNPELQLLIRIAKAAKTTVGALLGESFEISADDEQELLRFRSWINNKLPKIDTRQEPNAELQQDTQGESRIAEGESAQIELRAVGESMIGEGILPGDVLYVSPPGPGTTSAVGKVIACRLGDDIFVKRLVTEHQRYYLRSGDPRYTPIALGAKPKNFEILGIVVGRSGKID
jgi:transcriptional regulator with XRE-family HTH domain